MTNIRLLPIVIMAIAALFVLKTVGLVTNGGYVLTGVATAQAAGGGGGGSHGAPAAAAGETVTLPGEPTIADTTPTLSDAAPTLGQAADAGGHGSTSSADAHGASSDAGSGDASAPAEGGDHGAAAEGHGADVANSVAAENACAPYPADPSQTSVADGQLMVIPGDCPPLTDAVPQMVTGSGLVPMAGTDSGQTEQVLLDRLATRRAELDSYEQQLTMRASLVEAAEKRIEERQATMQSIEDQIAALVEQRKQMEEGHFASIVAMYETMKPKDAAKIFDNLDIEVLVRVSKMMSPRKMAPILAAMNTNRAQELTVRLASAEADPLDSMTPDDLAALPQIVGQ